MALNNTDELSLSTMAKLLALIQVILGITAIGLGAFAIIGSFFSVILGLVNITFVMPDYMLGWPFQALLLIGIGWILLNNGRSMLEYDTYAYGSSLYVNIIFIFIALTVGTVGVPLIVIAVVSLVLLFLPDVKRHWWNEFREDMGPRTKEMRYSLHLVKKSPLVVMGIIIIAVMVSIALLAPYITPYGPEERIWADAQEPPGTVSNVPKYTVDESYTHNASDVQVYPSIISHEIDIEAKHIEPADLTPNIHIVVVIRDTGNDTDINVPIVIQLYEMDQATFNTSSAAQRAAALKASVVRNDTARLEYRVPAVVDTYTWVVYFNSTQKASPWAVDIIANLQYNFWYPTHYWGTDDTGGDVYSRIVWAAAVDLRLSVTIVVVATTLGAVLGAASGYYGGKFDELMMRITDIFFAFPGLILAMAIVMALGERNLDNISLALMITWWPVYARLVRGQVLAEREKLYVEAARSVGASDGRILFSHIIPNTFQPLIVQATMDTGGVLLTAAGLSFIGFGPPAGVAEWGLMIATGQQYLTIAPWMSLFPGLAILMAALAFNLVGDGIRDILDPKLRRR